MTLLDKIMCEYVNILVLIYKIFLEQVNRTKVVYWERSLVQRPISCFQATMEKNLVQHF